MSGSIHDSDDARFEEISGDEVEDITQPENSGSDSLLPGVEEASPDESEDEDDRHPQMSESDHLTPGTESDSNMIEQSSPVGLHNENGRNTQAATTADREESQGLLQDRGEIISSTQQTAHSDHPTRNSLSTQIIHDLNDRNLSLEINHEDDSIQIY